MNMELSRRHFIRARGGRCRHDTRCARLRRYRIGLCNVDSRLEAIGDDRDPQHLHLLRGGLRHHHVFERQCGEGREGRDHSYRGRSRSPDQSRHAVSEGAGLLEFVHSKTRTLYPQIRKPGSDKFERVSWEFALDRIARLMKDDRDKNFIAKNADGVTVNRWLSTGILAASATSNETAWATYKVVRGAGMVAFDNQARV